MDNIENTSRMRRYDSLNLVRAIAICAVVMIHSSADFLKTNDVGTAAFFWGNIFDSIPRFAVPCFIMISGALMLDEQKPFSIPKLFTKNIAQILSLLFLWSAIYAVIYSVGIPLFTGDGFNLKIFIESLLLGHFHLWYLYMQVGLYLTLPFLRAFVCKDNKNLVLLYLAITLATQFMVPILRSVSLHRQSVSYFISLLKNFSLDFFSIYIAFFLAGWYIVHIGIPNKRARIGIYITTLFILFTTIVYVNSTGDYKNAYSESNLLIFIYSIGVFLALTNLKMSVNVKTAAAFLAKYSFGIYVIHIIVLNIVDKVLCTAMLSPATHIPLSFLLTLGISLLLTYVLSKIPIVKKLVRF